MIHTFQIFVPHTNRDLYMLQKRFKFEAYAINGPLHKMYPFAYFNIRHHKQSGMYYLSIHVDVIKLLGRANITEADFTVVNSKLKNLVFNIFLHVGFYEESFLARIDYRYDVKVPNTMERLLLLKLFKKLKVQYKWFKKHLGYVNEKGKFVPYETSVYHAAESSGTLSYDKEEKCKDDEVEIMPYEEDVLRFEVRLSKPHLDYKNNPNKCNNPLPRTLGAYFQKSVYNEYMKNMLLPIYFKGNFMKLNEAISVIDDSTLTPTMKKRLVEFLKRMNYSKATVSSPLKKNLVSKPTYRRYLCMLDELNIHPIVIPKNERGAPKLIENPLRRLIEDVLKDAA